MTQDDRDRLIESELPLVAIIANRIHCHLPPWVSIEDLIQVGRLALCQAADRYEQDRGVPFRLFAKHRIRGAILNYLGKCCRHNAEVSLEQAEPPSEDATIQGGSEAGELRRAIAQLPRVQRLVVSLSLEGLTTAEIATRTGSTWAAVYRANTNAVRRLKRILEKAA